MGREKKKGWWGGGGHAYKKTAPMREGRGKGGRKGRRKKKKKPRTHTGKTRNDLLSCGTRGETGEGRGAEKGNGGRREVKGRWGRGKGKGWEGSREEPGSGSGKGGGARGNASHTAHGTHLSTFHTPSIFRSSSIRSKKLCDLHSVIFVLGEPAFFCLLSWRRPSHARRAPVARPSRPQPGQVYITMFLDRMISSRSSSSCERKGEGARVSERPGGHHHHTQARARRRRRRRDRPLAPLCPLSSPAPLPSTSLFFLHLPLFLPSHQAALDVADGGGAGFGRHTHCREREEEREGW